MADDRITTRATLAGDCTFVQLAEELIARCDDRKLAATSGEIAREFAIATTLLEDAIMRHNRGVYQQHGTFDVTDAERATSQSATI